MSKKTDLDRIDFEILDELQNNARLSNKELAARIGLAPSSCLERVRGLTAGGVLRGFHADVDPQAMEIELEALISIRIRRHSRELIDQFQEHVRTLKEAVAVYHVAGANDFLVHVVVRDAGHLRHLVLDAFTSRPEVEHMETSIVFGHEMKWALPNLSGGEEPA